MRERNWKMKSNNNKQSNVARGMILSGTGKKQVFRHRTERRAKDRARKEFSVLCEKGNW